MVKGSMALTRALLVLIPLLTLVGCGGGDLTTGSTSSSSSGASTSSAAGIWTGSDSASGLALTGIIDVNGAATFIRADGAQYTGSAQLNGTALAISLDVYTQFGTFFGDGSDFGTGTLSGTLSENAISANVNFTTSDNNTVSSTWALTFDSLYDTASSLQTVSGTFVDESSNDPLDGATVSITSLGQMTAQSANTGCVLNGQISTVDTSFDAYAVSYHLQSCGGNFAALNAVAFSGLALFNSGASPSQIVLGVTGQNSGGANYGITSALTLN